MKSRLRKILKVLGLTLLLLLVVLAAVAVWLVRRPFPQTRGEIAVAGLSAPVEVIRDRWGVPQIYAANEHDLFFAQGYVHAQDRLWQMEFHRHISSGSLSQLFGRGTLDADRSLRTFGMHRNAERNWRLLEPGSKAILEAYSAGVNAFLDSHRGSLPVEFVILGVKPQKWTPIDSLAWVEMMTLVLGQNHAMEMERSALLPVFGADGVRQIMPGYPANGPVIVSPQEGSYPALPGAAAASAGPLLSAWLSGPALTRGSNAWVVHGSRTATGKPILANDTHLGLEMPSVWYENGLHGGRFDTAGFSFAGLPLVLIGHNSRIAWGISAMNGDAQDLFVETFNDRHQYRVGNEWKEPQIIKEEIPLPGGKSEPFEIVATRHGPIINEIANLKGKPPLALRWTAWDDNRVFDSLVHIGLAADWASFRQALSLWGAPALNMVYADVDGHIGYQATGHVPLRVPGTEGIVPVDGADGQYEWQGIIPFDEMPRLFDPPSGFIVTANNKVVSDSYPHLIGRDFAGPYRAERIGQLLAANPHISLDQMAAVQSDVKSLQAAELRPFLAAVKPANDLETRALREVQAWNLEFTPESAGAAIYYTWYSKLLPDLFGDELGKDFKFHQGMLSAQGAVIAKILHDGSPWIDDRRTPQKETRDDIVRRSFSEAVQWLAQQLGNDPAAWQWGKLHQAVFAHQPFGNSGVAPLIKIFNGKRVPVGGENDTISAASPNLEQPFSAGFGSSQRLLADLSDLGRSRVVNSTGQSGLVFHRHSEDQIDLWSRHEYRPLLFSRPAVEQAAEGRLVLKPR